MWSSGRSEASLEASFPVPIEIRTIRNARRLRLRFDDGSGTLKLTCPPRTSRRKALAWALDQREWIDAQLARAETAVPFEPDAVIPVEGAETKLVWAEGLPRTPAFAAGELRCGGPVVGFSRRVETFLKRRALDVMSREAAEYALKSGVAIASISVGDAGSRWGSCSSQGRVRLSWRLILAPPYVLDYLAAHEVAHLVEMNHSARFWRVVGRACGHVERAKNWLDTHGNDLHRYGVED